MPNAEERICSACLAIMAPAPLLPPLPVGWVARLRQAVAAGDTDELRRLDVELTRLRQG